jgi:hypothetical protein
MQLVKELLYEEYILKTQYFATDEKRAEDVIILKKLQAIGELLDYYDAEIKERYNYEK